MIFLSAQTRELEEALANLAKAAKVDHGLVIKEEAKYIVQTIMKFTPPNSRPQGINAIRRDINRVAEPLNYETFESKASKGGFYKSMAKYVRARNVSKIQDLLNNPKFTHYYGRKLLANGSEIMAEHHRLRNNRGNVAIQRNKALALGRDLSRYRKDVEGAVGWHISGWIPTAKATGARYKTMFDRFKVTRSGSVLLNFKTENPFIIATAYNTKIPNYQRIINGAVNSRIATTIKKLERVKANRAVNLGFIKVNGPLIQIENKAA